MATYLSNELLRFLKALDDDLGTPVYELASSIQMSPSEVKSCLEGLSEQGLVDVQEERARLTRKGTLLLKEGVSRWSHIVGASQSAPADLKQLEASIDREVEKLSRG